MTNSIKTALRIDKLIGRPISIILGLNVQILEKLLGRKHVIPMSPSRILITKFMGIGSIIQSLPLIMDLKQNYSQTEIVLATFKGNRAFVELIPAIHKVYYIDDTNYIRLLITLLKSIICLRLKSPSMSIDLEVYSNFSGIFNSLVFAPIRMGYFLINTTHKNMIYTHQLYFNRFKHISEIYQQMSLMLGITTKQRTFWRQDELPIQLQDRHYEEYKQLLEKYCVSKDHKIVLVNINASELCIERRWPSQSFKSVIQQLAKKKQIIQFLMGSKEEHAYNQQCLDQLNKLTLSQVHNIAGEISLGGLLVLLKQGHLLLTNDSGPMHLAGLMNCPIVSLWGPGIPQSYAPLNKNHRVIYKDIYCSPCLYMADELSCQGDNQCMQMIQPPEVIEACLEQCNLS